MQLTTTLHDLYKFYKKYPEYKGKISVETRFGFYPINDCQITSKNSEVYQLTTEYGKVIKTSPEHMLYSHDMQWKHVKNLTLSDAIFTYDGLEKIKTIKKLSHKKDLFDIEVDSVHEFYANGIVSHNSNITDTLVYALYGQTRNNLKNGNIWNKYIGSKEMRVVAWFDVDTKHYKVSSGFNKYGAPYCHLVEFVNDKEVDITKSSIIETRKYLANEILHCDIDIFLRTILLTSDQNYNFFRLSKYEKKQFIEKLFDTSVFGDIYNSIHRQILDTDKLIISKQNKLLVLNQNSSTYSEKIEKYNIDKLTKFTDLSILVSQLEAKQNQLKNTEIKTNSEEVEKYTNAIDKLSVAIDKLQQQINVLTRKNDKIDVAIHKLNSSSEQKQKIIDKHSEVLNKLCDDCKKVFKDYYNLTNYANEISENSEKIKELNKQKQTNSNDSQKLSDQINLYISKLDAAKKKIKNLTAEVEKTNKDLALVESKLITTKQELTKLENSENPYTELFESNNKELKTETAELDNISENYKYLKYAENIVSQDTLRKFIIGDLVGLLNNKLKTYLIKFGAKYDVKFDADMSYTFNTPGGECEYDNFSAGERARLMIASCFAFRDFMYIRNSFSCNILMLDEFIDGAIDSLAIESILSLLEEFTKLYKQNVYVISHRKEIDNDKFDHIIQVVKTNNISKITYLN